MTKVIYSDYYLPDNFIHVSEFLKISKFKQAHDDYFAECFISQSKLENIAIEKEKNEIEIFSVLMEKCFSNGPVAPEDITHIIYTNPENWEIDGVYIPYYLQRKFDLFNASIVGMIQECVTTLQAIQTANSIIASGNGNKILILPLCYGWKDEDRYTGATVVGDGAGLLVVGPEGESGTVKTGLSVSDGTYSYNKYRKIPSRISGLEIAKGGANFIVRFLKINNLTLDDIKLIIPQNINYSEYHMYTQLLGVDVSKFFLENISTGGHLAEVDSIRNYSDVMGKNMLREGDLVLLYGSGTIGKGMDSVYNTVLVQI
jgi:3-oxoacyl-[acyl-carrier-protein] synthase III